MVSVILSSTCSSQGMGVQQCLGWAAVLSQAPEGPLSLYFLEFPCKKFKSNFLLSPWTGLKRPDQASRVATQRPLYWSLWEPLSSPLGRVGEGVLLGRLSLILPADAFCSNPGPLVLGDPRPLYHSEPQLVPLGVKPVRVPSSCGCHQGEPLTAYSEPCPTLEDN